MYTSKGSPKPGYDLKAGDWQVGDLGSYTYFRIWTWCLRYVKPIVCHWVGHIPKRYSTLIEYKAELICRRCLRRVMPPFYVASEENIEGFSTPVRTYFPQQFTTMEDAAAFISQRKAIPAFANTTFLILEEDPRAETIRAKAFDDA